jgi:hypothetical protein
MNQFTYHFEDLSIVNGSAVYAYGEADISYKIRRKDPSVGILNDYIDDIEVVSITVYPSHDGEPNLRVDYGNWLYQLIENALHASGEMIEACRNDAE